MDMRHTGGWAAVPLVLLLASGCVITTRADRRAAQELAERMYPGQLRLVRAGTLFPETSGSEVTFAVRGDPDAAVVLRIGSGRNGRAPGPCEEALRTARRRGERAAAEWRALNVAFARRGQRVLGVTSARGRGGPVLEPWIAAPLNNGNVAATLDRLGGCLRAWAEALPSGRGAGEREGVSWVSVHVVPPRAAQGLPGGRRGDPTVLRMASPRVLGALAKRTYHTVGFRWRDGTIVAGSGRIVRTQPFEEGQRFADRAREAVAGWLAEAHPGAAVVDAFNGVWYLAPGRVDRLRGYVLLRTGKPAAGERRPGDLAALVTVDEDGRLYGTPTLLTGIRDERGALRLPPIPDAAGHAGTGR